MITKHKLLSNKKPILAAPKGVVSIPLEKDEAIRFMDWCRLQKMIEPYVVHIPNEGKRSFHYGVLQKKMGTRKGVSDYFIAVPSQGAHGLWIEMKRCNRSPISPEQRVWIAKMSEMGYRAEFAYGADHAIQICKEYFQI